MAGLTEASTPLSENTETLPITLVAAELIVLLSSFPPKQNKPRQVNTDADKLLSCTDNQVQKFQTRLNGLKRKMPFFPCVIWFSAAWKSMGLCLFIVCIGFPFLNPIET